MAELKIGLKGFMALASLVAAALVADAVCVWILSGIDPGATDLSTNWAPCGCSLFTLM
ncbi:MAG TPA: hypothetical protein VM639_00090 [Dongiaceae bacterium]|nr:hypothetical protein [Dongiaceae bacterium]